MITRLLKMAGCDVTREQEVILRELIRSGGVNQIELAERVGQDPNNLSRTLSILESRGQIVRKTRGSDRRSKIIHVTSAGRAIHKEAFKAIEAYWTILFRGCSQDDIDTFIATVDRLSGNLGDYIKNGTSGPDD